MKDIKNINEEIKQIYDRLENQNNMLNLLIQDVQLIDLTLDENGLYGDY